MNYWSPKQRKCTLTVLIFGKRTSLHFQSEPNGIIPGLWIDSDVSPKHRRYHWGAHHCVPICGSLKNLVTYNCMTVIYFINLQVNTCILVFAESFRHIIKSHHDLKPLVHKKIAIVTLKSWGVKVVKDAFILGLTFLQNNIIQHNLMITSLFHDILSQS